MNNNTTNKSNKANVQLNNKPKKADDELYGEKYNLIDTLVQNVKDYKDFMAQVKADWSNDVSNPNNIIGKLK